MLVVINRYNGDDPDPKIRVVEVQAEELTEELVLKVFDKTFQSRYDDPNLFDVAKPEYWQRTKSDDIWQLYNKSNGHVWVISRFVPRVVS